jgi:hypothetical protein
MPRAELTGVTLAALACFLALGCAHEEPAWIRTREPVAAGAPPDFVGVGSCATAGIAENDYRDAAYRRACAEIAAQLRSRVTTQWRESTTVVQGGPAATRDTTFETERLLESSELLEGIRLADTYLDAGAGVFYARAMLDVNATARNLAARIREADRQAALAAERARLCREKRAWGALIMAIDALGGHLERGRHDRALLRVLPGATARACEHDAGVEIPAPPVDFAIDLLAVEGGDQRGLPGRPLARPLVFRAWAHVLGAPESEREPLGGLPLSVAIDSADAVVRPEKITTDVFGTASVGVERVPSRGGAFSITVAADAPGAAVLGVSARAQVRLQVLDRKNARLGLELLLSDRDRKGRAWALDRLSAALADVGLLRDRCVFADALPSERTLGQLADADLVICAFLAADLLVPPSRQDSSTVEVRLTFRVWAPPVQAWLWTSTEVTATGVGRDPLGATETALAAAVDGLLGDVKGAIANVLEPP